MYTPRKDAVAHAAEVRTAGEKLAKEMNDRPDRNVVSHTSVLEHGMTPWDKAAVEWASGDITVEGQFD
jgi:hypothetical protein